MALHIEEFATMGIASDGRSVPVAGEALTSQTRTLSGTSAQSAAFAGGTMFVRLCADVVCHYAIGESPVATTSSARLPADTIEYRAVRGGQKIAAITG